MSSKKDMCETPGCWQEVKIKSRGLCGACNSWFLFWSKRSAADAIDRRRSINRIGERLNNMTPWVTQIKQAQKERARKQKAKLRVVKRKAAAAAKGKGRLRSAT